MCDYTEKTWISNPSILIQKWQAVIPDCKKTKEQNLNAVVRLSLYIGIIVAVRFQDIKYMIFSVLFSLFLSLLYEIFYMKKSYLNIEKPDNKQGNLSHHLKNKLKSANNKLENAKDKFSDIQEMLIRKTPDYLSFAKKSNLMPENNCKQDSIYSRSNGTHGKGTVSCAPHSGTINRWAVRSDPNYS